MVEVGRDVPIAPIKHAGHDLGAMGTGTSGSQARPTSDSDGLVGVFIWSFRRGERLGLRIKIKIRSGRARPGAFVQPRDVGLEFGEAVVQGAIAGLVGVEDFGFVFVEFFKEPVEVVIETRAQGFKFAGDVAAGFVEFGLGDELGFARFAAKEFQAKAGEAEDCGQCEDHLAGEEHIILRKHTFGS